MDQNNQNPLGGSQEPSTPPNIGSDPNGLQKLPISQPNTNAPVSGAPAGPPPEAMADLGHHYGLGKIVQSLFGNERSYTVDPATGKTVEQDVPTKPGQIWRNIISGVILGGAAAQKSGAKDFLGGAVQGGAAEIQNKQNQDKAKQDAARADFKQNLEARRANTEEKHATTQIDLMRAQIAMHNAQTLREIKNSQFEDYTHHEQMAANGKAQFSALEAAGVPYTFRDVPETEVNDILKSNPDATHLLWQPTGTKIVLDKDGNPQHINTLSAMKVDPNTQVNVTDANVKAWKAVGLDKVYGSDLWNHLTKDKQLDVQHYLTFTQQEKKMREDKYEKDKKDLDTQKEQSAIDFSKAQISHLKAETSKIYTEAKDKKDAEEAWRLFTTASGDVSKMTPDQIKKLKPITDTLIKAADEQRKEFGDQLKSDPNYGNTDQGKDQYKTLEMYHNALNKILGLQAKLPASTTTGGVSRAGVQMDSTTANVYDNNAKSGGQPLSWDNINKIPLLTTNSQRVALAKAMKTVIPFTAVQSMATEIGKSPEEVIKKLKDQGVNVEEESQPANSFSQK
jgi:hypothetical protein